MFAAFAFKTGAAPVQDQSFNNCENDTMKLSVSEAKLTGLYARNCATIQQVLILKLPSGPKSYRTYRGTGPIKTVANTILLNVI